MDIRQKPKMFLKFRHKSCVLTEHSITQLLNSGALDQADFVALVFLMCDVHLMKTLLKVLVSLRRTDLLPNLYEIIIKFSNWEQKFLAALLCVGNKQALMEMGLSVQDVEQKVKTSNIALSPSRVVLYKIFEGLNERSMRKLISHLYQVGAPRPENKWERLELYFIFWHLEGFIDVDNAYSFEAVAQSLKDIGCSEMGGSLLEPDIHLLHNSVSDTDLTLGVYQIRNPEKPGLCIIINQSQYGSEQRNRDSSEFDRDRLEELMTSMNFHVIVFEDVHSSDFCLKIKETVKEHFTSDCSIFILIVMAHGDTGFIVCPDASLIEEDGTKEQAVIGNLIKNWFCSSKRDDFRPERFGLGHVYVDNIQQMLLHCEILREIPKVLILNACRGKDLFTAFPYYAPECAAPPPPQYTDLITCHSALPGFVCFRPEKGSVFIYVLCDVLRKRPDIEICELFTLVNARLMQPTPDMSKIFEPGRVAYEKKLASPIDFTSSLRKKLYLKMPNPGGGEGVS